MTRKVKISNSPKTPSNIIHTVQFLTYCDDEDDITTIRLTTCTHQNAMRIFECLFNKVESGTASESTSLRTHLYLSNKDAFIKIVIQKLVLNNFITKDFATQIVADYSFKNAMTITLEIQSKAPDVLPHNFWSQRKKTAFEGDLSWNFNIALLDSYNDNPTATCD